MTGYRLVIIEQRNKEKRCLVGLNKAKYFYKTILDLFFMHGLVILGGGGVGGIRPSPTNPLAMGLVLYDDHTMICQIMQCFTRN